MPHAFCIISDPGANAEHLLRMIFRILSFTCGAAAAASYLIRRDMPCDNDTVSSKEGQGASRGKQDGRAWQEQQQAEGQWAAADYCSLDAAAAAASSAHFFACGGPAHDHRQYCARALHGMAADMAQGRSKLHVPPARQQHLLQLLTCSRTRCCSSSRCLIGTTHR